MPLVALDKHTNKRVNLLEVKNVVALAENQFICQSCSGDMIIVNEHIRQESIVSAHFRHKSECDGLYDKHAESPQHLWGKQELSKYLKHIYQGIADVCVDLEVPIDMEWRSRGRIADICVEFPFGLRKIHEVQLSKISLSEIQERTNDYEKAGCIVYWYFWEKSLTEEIEYWTYDHQGVCFFLKYSSEGVAVHSLENSSNKYSQQYAAFPSNK